MKVSVKNRFLLKAILLGFVALFLMSIPIVIFPNTSQNNLVSMQEQLAALEASSGGRLGVAAVDIGGNISIQYRAEERFPMCSTSKFITVAAILKQSMTNPRLLQQRIYYRKEELAFSTYSPVTSKHITTGMTIAELCAAAIEYSDNTAMNLLIEKLGGPKAITAFARSIGDNTFRLNRLEPALNSAIPGDLRDTSTPIAMEKSLQRLVLGDVLALPQRELLQSWLKGNTTGGARIRAGVPIGWVVGDKTGSGHYGATNDIAVIWPPHSAPIVIVIYFTQYQKNAVHRDSVVASAAKIVINGVM